MDKNKSFLIVVVVVAIAIFIGVSFWPKKSEDHSVSTIEKADPALLVKPHSPRKGNEDAKVTIVEFFDPECEACRAMHGILKTLLVEYEGKIKIVMRYMPLHGNSRLAATALEEAREQGKFDESLEALFEHQPEWASHGQPKPELIPVLLAKVGVNEASLESSNLMSKHIWKIDIDQSDGEKLGIHQTPTFFVNGKILPEIGYPQIRQAIEDALKN